MDAAFRRPLTAALFLFAVGCNSTDPPRVSGWSQSSATARGQAPVSPLQPPAPVVPVTPAVVPTQAAAPVVPVSASNPSEPSHEKATTRVRAVAVIGSDIVITDDEVWQLVRQRAGEYARLTGPDRAAKEKEIFDDSLRSLIERELVLDDFLGKVKKNRPALVPEIKDNAAQQAAKQIAAFKRQNGMKSEEEFNRALRAMGLSAKSLERQMERNSMMQMYMGELVRAKAKQITLAQVDQFYRSHPDEFKVPDQVQWQHLFVAYSRFATPDEARRYATGLLQQAKGGADLAKLATEHGHGDSKLRQGEGAGAKRGEVQPRELEETVFSLSAGQISELIPTATGLHVVKVTEREYAGTRPFDEKTQTAIRMKLAADIQKAEYDRLIEELWRKTTVRIVDAPK